MSPVARLHSLLALLFLLLPAAAWAEAASTESPPSGNPPVLVTPAREDELPPALAAGGDGAQAETAPSTGDAVQAEAAEVDEFADEELFEEDEISDPLERGNRSVLRFNQGVERWVFDPLTKAYRWVLPAPARRSVSRAMQNLNTPVYLVNHLLQLEVKAAAETLGSFVLNSTLGMGGLFEPSRELGWERKSADFGQTLGVYGVGAGPFLVLPVFGPTTLRDGMGSIVDRMFQPLTYVIGFTPQVLIGGGAGISLYDKHADELDALEESSVDFYSALRSAYVQARERDIARRREAHPFMGR